MSSDDFPIQCGTFDDVPPLSAEMQAVLFPASVPPPSPAELLRKWIYYRRHGLGRRIHKGYVQAVRGGRLLEISGSILTTGYPLYLPASEVEIVLFQTVEEEAAERAKEDPGPRTPHALIIYPA